MVRCKDCGLLAVRNPHADTLATTGQTIRESGKRPRDDVDRHGLPAVPDLVCFAMEQAFAERWNSRTDIEERVALALTVEHECGSFIKDQPGYTPREHREMQFLEEMRERERRFQAESRERDRKFQESVRQSDREWQEKQREADRDWQAKQKEKDLAVQLLWKRWDRAWTSFWAVVMLVLGYALRFFGW